MDVHPTKNASIGIDPYPFFPKNEGLTINYQGFDLVYPHPQETNRQYMVFSVVSYLFKV